MDEWQPWQKAYANGTIVIWPPDTVREIVNAQRDAYDPLSQSHCEAHITVTQPFFQPLSNQALEEILGVLMHHQAFEISYGPINTFLPYPCIWYEIRPPERILALRQELHATGYFNLTLQHTEDFVPHMTITEGLSGPPVDEKLLERLELESDHGTFLCEELAHIVPDEYFQFGVVQKLPLGRAG